MISESALAQFDAQVRQSTRPDEPGAVVQADEHIVRWIAADAQGSSWITWSRLDEATADAVIAEQVTFFDARHQQFEWKLYDYDRPADLGSRLLAAGFVPDDTEALMVVETASVTGEVALPDGWRVEEVTGLDGLSRMMAVHDRVFGSPEPQLRHALAAKVAAAPESVGMMIAYAGDEPVSAARVEFPPSCDFASLWGGGTVEAWRGRGLYRALVAYRARLAAARGYRYLQVDALPTSEPILTRLGFVPLARTTPFIWDPELAREAPA